MCVCTPKRDQSVEVRQPSSSTSSCHSLLFSIHVRFSVSVFSTCLLEGRVDNTVCVCVCVCVCVFKLPCTCWPNQFSNAHFYLDTLWSLYTVQRDVVWSKPEMSSYRRHGMQHTTVVFTRFVLYMVKSMWTFLHFCALLNRQCFFMVWQNFPSTNEWKS